MVQYTEDGHIKLQNLEALVWTLTAITILLSGARYAISAATKKAFQWDGLTHLLALLSMVTMVALFQTLFRDGYYITAIERHLAPPPTQEAFIELYIRFRRRSDAIALLFFTSTWLVKVTFLLYYRSIFQINKNFRRAWWVVLGFVFVTYWVTFAGVLTQCGPAKNSFNLKECTRPGRARYESQLLKYQFAVSIASDVAVMALPVWMLKDLHVKTSQKIGLAAMFSLGIIIIIFEILRTIKSLGQTSFSEVAIYDVLENSVALIVSSITHYRGFISTRRRNRTNRQYAHLKAPSHPIKSSDSHRLKIIGVEHGPGTTQEESGYSLSTSQYTGDDPEVLVRVPEQIHV